MWKDRKMRESNKMKKITKNYPGTSRARISMSRITMKTNSTRTNREKTAWTNRLMMSRWTATLLPSSNNRTTTSQWTSAW